LNCPTCGKELILDQRNEWILCSSNDHKFRKTDWDDACKNTITLKILSDTIITIKNMLSNPKTILNEIQRAHLEGQISAFRCMADYLRNQD